MKYLGLVLLLAFTGFVFWGGSSSVLAESTQDGSIVGVVEEREQKDKDRTMTVDLKSDKLAFKKVTVKLTKKLNEKVRVMGKPDGCKTVKDKGKLSFVDCPPAFSFKVGLEFPVESLNDFNKLARKKLELEYSTSDGNKKQKFGVKNTPALTPQKPGDTAFIPGMVRPGFEFSITPKIAFRSGDWTVFIVDKGGKETKIDGQGLPKNEVDWGFYADNQDELDKIGRALKADYAKPNLPAKEKSVLEELVKDLEDKNRGLKGRAERQAKDNANQPQYFYVPKDALGRIRFRYTNPFGEVPVDDFSDTYLIKDNSPQSLTAPPKITNCTKRIFQGGELCVCGFFPSDFSRRRLLLDGKQLGSPMSGSTDSVIVLPENVSPGKHVITWDLDAFGKIGDPDIAFRQKPSASDRVEFLVLEVQASIDQNKLFTGQGTTLRLKIIGTEEKLPIALDNNTPEIVSVEGGTKQVIMTSGGTNNTIERNVKGTKRGNFDIKYKLDGPSCPCTPEETEKKLNEEIKDGGEKKVTGEAPVKPQPPVKESVACRRLKASCKKIEDRIPLIEKARQKALDECAKLPEFQRKGCIDTAKTIWDSILKDEKKRLKNCKSDYKLCQLIEKAGEDSTNKNPPPTGEPKNKEPIDCDKLQRTCLDLERALRAEEADLIKSLRRCDTLNPNDATKADSCRKREKEVYKSILENAKKKLAECRTRLAKCKKEDD